jgi:hypothetical protein
MWNEITRWWTRNHLEFTWFLIGFLTFGFFLDLAESDWSGAALNAFFIWVNYKLRKVF